MRYRFSKKGDVIFNDGWSFVLLNGRPAEIYFKKGYGFWAHCYIAREKFSKVERRMIAIDTKQNIFSYRRGVYFDRLAGIKFRRASGRNILGRIKTKKEKSL
jgi:hypothetical protein